MRLLIRAAGTMVEVRPWPKPFKPSNVPLACSYFLGLSKKRPSVITQQNSYGALAPTPPSRVDLTQPVNEFAYRVKEWTERREGMDIAVRHVLQRQLPDWLAGVAKKATEQAAAVVTDGTTDAGNSTTIVPENSNKPPRPVSTTETNSSSTTSSLKRSREDMRVATGAVTELRPSTSELSIRGGDTGDAVAPAPSSPSGSPSDDAETAQNEAGLSGVGEVAEWAVLESEGTNIKKAKTSAPRPPVTVRWCN